MAGKEDVVSVEVVVLVEEQQEVMAGKEVVVSVEQQEVVTEQFGKSADGSDHSRTLANLQSKFGRSPSSPSTSKLQCPKVPKQLREDVKDKDYYAPKRISLGPYYHGESYLKDGERLKLKLAEAYIQAIAWSRWESVEESVEKIYHKISDRIDELKDCYDYQESSDDDQKSIKKYNNDEFTAMMLVDGCALLWYILCVCLGADHKDYNIRYQDLRQDALLLENQLPYQLLQDLMKMVDVESGDEAWTVLFQEFFGMIDKSFFQEFFGIKEKEYSFLPKMNRKPKPRPDKEWRLCHHLLDLYRINFLGDESSSPTHSEAENGKNGRRSVGDMKDQVMASFRNVKELMAAGIRIKPSPTHYLRDISFTSNCVTACLRLPPITIDKSTKTLFFNLIAYEMSSDVDHRFISYLHFLDSLIDHADDVKELQSAGVLQNNLGTHEEVAEFFNTVSANLESNFHAYKDVRVRIGKHLMSHHTSKLKMYYNTKVRKWITQCLDTYFSSPWTIMAWVGAASALFFTAVQTYFSVFPH